MSLKHKRVFISGGTGHLGRALVLAFAQAGADVAFSYYRNEQKAAALLAELSAYPGKFLAVAMSVLDYESVQQAVAKTASELQGVDILINNAGIIQVMPLPLLEQEDWDLTFNVNVRGCFYVTKEVVRQMVAGQAGGVIINLGSVAGLRMLDVPVDYAASKAAIHGMTFALAKELTRFGIRVNCIAPGLLDGGIGTNIPPKHYADYMAHCAAGRPGMPEEVAALAVFLATPAAAYINAQVLVCDGGL